MVKKKILNPKEEKLIERKISYWTNQQELDKFNFNAVIVNFYGLMALIIAIWVGLSAIIFSISKFPLSLIGFMVLSLIVIIKIIRVRDELKEEKNKHNESFMARDKQIEELYFGLEVKKQELNERHEEIKKELKNER